ncbi:hypothetical protein Poli38472_007286 [Pythium oligandrum]|uniref:Uncharacterized protein n=1 Tax=Pythium oligandrum TaxID=41045 RepID=A0A8K1CA17_PYTOL|nr:hypothetical protein Poli38472_007286 [Pythium oligandrum]|eukprot:TMW59141.1 hypothetical protein Poli38472_007286 [Pythium oligandrum]
MPASMLMTSPEDWNAMWTTWMLLICVVVNGVTSFSCVIFMIHANYVVKRQEDKPVVCAPVATATHQEPTSISSPHPEEAASRVCGKRKSRELPVFTFRIAKEEEVVQGRFKRRRVAPARVFGRSPRRTRSFGDAEHQLRAPPAWKPAPLRRSVSHEQASAVERPAACQAQVQVPVASPATAAAVLREIRPLDVLSSVMARVSAIVMDKLREAARNAVDEMLTSMVSFVTYGLLLAVIRQYSAVTVGVSVDLGAFSIEL